MSAVIDSRHVEIVAVLPPIPLRRFDYVAYFADDPEGPQGHGASEEDALADLIEIVDGVAA